VASTGHKICGYLTNIGKEVLKIKDHFKPQNSENLKFKSMKKL